METFTWVINCNRIIKIIFKMYFLGGTPNNQLMTGGRYTHGFNGCIYGFEVQDSKMLDLGSKAISGINVKPCSR